LSLFLRQYLFGENTLDQEGYMTELGLHILMEFKDCSPAELNNLKLLESEMNHAATIAGATIIKSVFHQFSPQGVTGVVVVAESHLAMHTWPEHNFAAVDFFTCNHSMDYLKAYAHLAKILSSKTHSYVTVKRGLIDQEIPVHEV
jgi:S-adenosylmethionine decarboxylase proenzyme